MNEHTNSPLSTETNLSRSSFLSEEDISDSDLILQIDEFKIETSDLESSIDVVDDCCSDDSYVSLTGFDLDLDTDPDILSPPTQSPEISPLIVSIPLLIFSQLFGDKSTAGDVDKQQCQNDTHIFECSPVSGKSTNTKRLSRTKRRLHRSPSKVRKASCYNYSVYMCHNNCLTSILRLSIVSLCTFRMKIVAQQPHQVRVLQLKNLFKILYQKF